MKRLLTLGDSTCFYYLEYLTKCTEGSLIVSTKEGREEAAVDLNIPVGSNCGDSSMLLAYLKREVKEGNLDKYDIISFNCGLHDIKYDVEMKKIQIDSESYEKNMTEICEILKNVNCKAVFINSIPVYDDIHNEPGKWPHSGKIDRYNESIVKYNEIAEKVMAKYGFPVIDTYAFIRSFGSDALRDHVHLKAEYAQLQAAYVAGSLKMISQFI
ncbi:MAG: SGNH/GDSL hydrolase family protein [Clostridia bacterium]|nr:SGNH/GDSL hydrolase family protein [Clostridia bacterium]